VSIVPVSIIGSGRIMPKRSVKIKSGQIKLVIGEPIEVKSFDIEKRHELIKTVRDTIIKNYDAWQEPENLNIKDMESKAI
jgi:1-acyl-sn-glycerol-3-phosphate acyltransferase